MGFPKSLAICFVGARLGAVVRAEEELQTLKAAVTALAAAHAAAEPGGAHDLLLHQTIARASRNAMFLVALDALEAAAEGIIVPSLALIAEGPQQRARRVELEHAAIVEAIERGEPDCAEAAMWLHLLNARNRATNMRW